MCHHYRWLLQSLEGDLGSCSYRKSEIKAHYEMGMQFAKLSHEWSDIFD